MECFFLSLSHQVVFADPHLPLSEGFVKRLSEEERVAHPVLKNIRGPLHRIMSLESLVKDRYDKHEDCNLYFFKLASSSDRGKFRTS